MLFIGFFYTMPQMKGAGTTLAYIFPGLPYWAGVVLVGAVITLNVALGGMKGITLVQAFQYWLRCSPSPCPSSCSWRCMGIMELIWVRTKRSRQPTFLPQADATANGD